MPMTATERSNMYKGYLAREGYVPQEEDRHVKFKYNGDSYFITVDVKDENYFQPACPLRKIDGSDEPEIVKATRHAADVTAEYKVAKISVMRFPGHKVSVMATVEEFLPNPQDFEDIFWRALDVCDKAGDEFLKSITG
jgi:hypothetical protein